MYTIRKLFKMEIAHVLDSSYSEDCQLIHGHSYKLEIFITSDTLNKDGMVIDFKKLKEIVNEKIVNEFDHAFVMSRTGAYSSVFKIVTNGLVLVDYNPTAENMVKDFYYRIYSEIRKWIPSFICMKIRLHETDTGYAEYWDKG